MRGERKHGEHSVWRKWKGGVGGMKGEWSNSLGERRAKWTESVGRGGLVRGVTERVEEESGANAG